MREQEAKAALLATKRGQKMTLAERTQFLMPYEMTTSLFNEILNCKRPVTTDYALRIEAALGIKAYMLVNMQSEYNLQTARQDSHLSTILSKIRSAAAML